jgi:prepilin-type N-terminal cleavage/methylation domain-containing protein
MTNPAPFRPREAGFTMVELLLALALGALVAGILGALIHGLLTAGNGQTSRIKGPHAARAAVRTLSREIACAYAPPVKDLDPLQLSTSTEPGQPLLLLSFYVPVPGPIGADIEQVSYAVQRLEKSQRELQRISVPCAGPYTNAPVTNRLLTGQFTLTVEAMEEGEALSDWPPAQATETVLPASMRLVLTPDGQNPIEMEVLIQAALGIPSPLEREPATTDPEPTGN